MKMNHRGTAPVMILAAALLAFAPGISAQTRYSGQQQGQQQSQPQAKTFSGKIEKLQNGQFALITGQTPKGQVAGHFLDDQKDAKKYEGKQVKVTGTLDMASNTIHGTNIQAA